MKVIELDICPQVCLFIYSDVIRDFCNLRENHKSSLLPVFDSVHCSHGGNHVLFHQPCLQLTSSSVPRPRHLPRRARKFLCSII